MTLDEVTALKDLKIIALKRLIKIKTKQVVSGNKQSFSNGNDGFSTFVGSKLRI